MAIICTLELIQSKSGVQILLSGETGSLVFATSCSCTRYKVNNILCTEQFSLNLFFWDPNGALKTSLFQDKKAYPHCGKKNQVGSYNGQTVDRFLRIGVLDKFDPNSRSSQVYQSAVVHQNYLYFIDGTKSMLSRANLDDCKTKRTDCIRLVIFHLQSD